MSGSNEKRSFRGIFLLSFIICGIAIALSSFAVKPIYIYLSSDIMYMDSWILYALEVMITLLDVFIYSVIFATAIYFVFYKTNEMRIYVLFLIGAAVFITRILFDLVMTLAFNGALSEDDMAVVAIQLALEMILLTLVYFIAQAFTRRRVIDSFYKEIRLLNIKNPLQTSAIFAGAILSINNIISRLWSDIQYGLPTSVGECLVMLAYYLSDIAIALVSYIAIVAILRIFQAQKH